MNRKQMRLTEVAQALDVEYQWLRYRVRTWQTPLDPTLVAFSTEDMAVLRRWLKGQTPTPWRDRTPTPAGK